MQSPSRNKLNSGGARSYGACARSLLAAAGASAPRSGAQGRA